MPKFSEQSLKNLAECDSRLQELFMAVGSVFDCSIVCGRRSHADQLVRFNDGDSKARPGESLHNVPAPGLSLAVDALPYPHELLDLRRFYYFTGIIRGIAIIMGVPVRCGVDWHDELLVKTIKDRPRHTFDDLAHWEIITSRPSLP